MLMMMADGGDLAAAGQLEEEVVGVARLAPAKAAPSPRRVARPAMDAEAAGLMPSSVIRSWIQDASPTLVPGGRGSAAAVSLSSSAAGVVSPLSKKKKTTKDSSLRIDELRLRLAPSGPFCASSSQQQRHQLLSPWPGDLQAMLLSRMTVPGVADEPPPVARSRGRKRGRDAAAAAAAPFDAFAEANAGGENVHDFGFGEFGAAGGGGFDVLQRPQDDLGAGDGWGGGWRLSPADALVAANAGDEFGTNYGEGGIGRIGGRIADDGIERMRAAFLASAGRGGGGGGGGGALGRSPGSAGLAAGATPGGGKGTSSGDRPSSDADGIRSGDENANNEAIRPRGWGGGGGGGGGGADLGAVDEDWAQTQFPAGGSLLEETQEEKARRASSATATRLPRVEELPAATRAAVQAMRARFSALVNSGRPPRLSLDAAATGVTESGGGGNARPPGRLDAARLFYQVCACVSAGYVKAAQRSPYGDVLLAPGRAMGNLEVGGGGGSGGGGGGAAAVSGRVVSARA